MSITEFMGKPISDLRNMGETEGFELFEQKTKQRNMLVEKPEKYNTLTPICLGFIVGVSISYFSKRR